jgi:4-amino-4-deoxy-L-arabinose transferase-like glycosyltransferase
MTRRIELFVVLGILLVAVVLRVGWHWQAPRGWREDELSNALVVSQHVLEGDVRLYYDDASGHEGLYHWLQAGTMALFGPGVAGIRGVSIACGVLSVLLLYLLAREMFTPGVATMASFALAVSFWGMMYSRSGQRHISVVVTTLAAMVLFWRALCRYLIHRRGAEDTEKNDTLLRSPRLFGTNPLLNYALAGLALGVGFYTYFASRGVPLILLAFAVYLSIWQRGLLKKAWRGLIGMALIAGALWLPLLVTLRTNPEAEARVSELAAPIEAAREGDFSLIGEFGLQTLSMFTHDGDPEVLYNVPNRPVFSPLGGALFWGGVLWAVFQALIKRDERYALLLLWLFAGLAPGALSVPPASLGHTILSQPVVMMMPALALDALWTRWRRVTIALAAIFLAWEGVRGPYDYFLVWPDDSFNRVLHHSDLHEAAVLLNAEPETMRDVAIGSYLLEQWDQQVMALDLNPPREWRVRAFDPRAAVLYPAGSEARWVLPAYLHLEGSWAQTFLFDALEERTPFLYYRDVTPFSESEWAQERITFEQAEQHCAEGRLSYTNTTEHIPLGDFDNGLALVVTGGAVCEGNTLTVITAWEVGEALALPERPLFSKPPAPGQDDTPRLAIFIQLLDEAGQRVTGWDGLSVDPYTLYPVDRFLQRSWIPMEGVPTGEYTLVVGLYNPMTGARHLDMLTGDDHVTLAELEVTP